MNIILCTFVDKHGHIKYQPNSFRPKEVDVCVSNYNMKNIGNKTLYYTLLDYDENVGIDTCWTTSETLRRCEEINADSNVKIFTRIQDFYSHANEIQFAFKDEFDDWDDELNMEELKKFCSDMDRQFLGEKDGIKFFRYTKKNI